MDDYKKNNTILVTGGAGYIGSHACKALSRAGYLPVTYDDLSNGHRDAVKWGPLEVGNVGDRERLNAVFQTYRPGAVMHFAAFIEAGESVGNPGKYYKNNTCNAVNLFQTMCDHHVNKLIFSSTAAVYGTPQTIPITETHPLDPINPYGVSKRMVERILEDFSRAYDIRFICLRYFNAAGADPEGECGENHHPESHLIPLILQTALGIRPHITVFGSDYDTPDGSGVRDYVHVSDLIAAHILALESLADDRSGQAYNLGNGLGFSVREVIDVARKVTGREIKVENGPRRSGDPSRLVADSGKAIRELGWQPKHADLAEIVETAWRWALKS